MLKQTSCSIKYYVSYNKILHHEKMNVNPQEENKKREPMALSLLQLHVALNNQNRYDR